ncbi:MAG: hydroxyacid dehydrogenase [Clostridia bacterium]|nr:hydroxyacid dehydrogenase [Clostridia bacterium]
MVFFETRQDEKNFFKRRLKQYQVSFFHNILDLKELECVDDVEILSVFVHSNITASVIESLPNLKLIATRSTGFNHIDLEACRKRRITVANVPVYGENTVAEHTFALILALSRNVYKAYVRTIRNNFSMEGLQGFDLKDKTIGVIGAGHIGLHVIRMAKGFGMHALAYDVRKNPFLAEVLRFKYVSLEELLAQSDVISLHAPYNKHTHHLINRENIRLIKKGALLVNTARGELIDTDALVKALDEGILSGAGLDVLEGEDLFLEDQALLSPGVTREILENVVMNNILLRREDVVITPHIGFNSREAAQRIMETTLGNIQAFLAGTPENVVSIVASRQSSVVST